MKCVRSIDVPWRILLLTAASVLFFRFQNFVFTGGLDASWQAAMSYGALHGLLSGFDYQWTWGPLGRLVFPVTLGQGPLPALALQLSVFLLFSFSVISFFWHNLQFKAPSRVLLGLATLAILGSCPEDLFLYAGFFFALNEIRSERRGRWLGALLALTLLALLVKIAFGVSLLALVGGLATFEFLEKRKFRVWPRFRYFLALPAILLLWVLLWLVTGGSLGSWAQMLKATLGLSRGYFMAMTSLKSEDSFLLLALSALILFSAFWSLRNVAAGRMLAIAGAPLFYLGLRYGVTKQLVILSPLMYVFTLLGFAVLPRIGLRIRFLFLMALLFTSLSANFNWHDHRLATEQQLFGRLNMSFGRFRDFSMLHWFRDWDRRSENSVESGKKWMAPPELATVIGDEPVDAYPFELSVLAASKLNWRPRPMIQAYSAYLPTFDQMDSMHFASAQAPRFVLFHGDTNLRVPQRSIDGRLVLNDEPQTVRSLLSNYRLHSSKDLWHLFERSPRPSRYEPVTESTVVWEEWNDVPHGAFAPGTIAVAEVEIDRTLVGKLRATFYKEPPQMMEYRLRDGTILSHRYIPDMARNGIWISPLWKDITGKESFDVVAFRLQKSLGHDFCFRDSPRLRWMRFQIAL